jgi:hypothetical protein
MSSTITNTSSQPRRLGRSILAVFIGLLVIVVLSAATDALLHGTGIFPPVGQPMSNALFMLAFAYRAIESIFGSFITARLAPNRPVAHALVLGGVGVVFSLIGVLVSWGNPAMGPLWYPFALVLVAMPSGWLGGVLYHNWHSER